VLVVLVMLILSCFLFAKIVYRCGLGFGLVTGEKFFVWAMLVPDCIVLFTAVH
jgi:hypothetical protein